MAAQFMEATDKPVAERRRRSPGVILLAAALFFLTVPFAVFASGYGADVYGGGVYGTGVVPAVTPPVNVSGGPLPGYVTPPIIAAAFATSTVIAATSSIASTVPSASTGATSIATTSTSTFRFGRSLQFRDHDADVKRLQEFLNGHGSPVASNGSGSQGQETDYFGVLTLQAVIHFQNSHANEILKPVGLSSGTGYFGPATRAFIDALSN